MITQLSKDISGSYCRILDHRTFVKGEIDIFLNAFELQRNDKEVDGLLKAAEIAVELKSSVSEKSCLVATTHLTSISDVLKVWLHKFEELPSENKNSNIILEKARLTRDKRRREFFDDLSNKYKRIQNTFEEKEEEIIELYTDLELKLNTHN